MCSIVLTEFGLHITIIVYLCGERNYLHVDVLNRRYLNGTLFLDQLYMYIVYSCLKLIIAFGNIEYISLDQSCLQIDNTLMEKNC